MKVLFVHNNYPAQFRNLAEALAADPANEVAAIGSESARETSGVRLMRYRMPPFDVSATHSFARRFDIDCRRAEQVLFVATALASSGFSPDLVFAHCGWGETLPLRAAFPKARHVVYCEYYYRSEGQDVDFDELQGEMGIDGHTGVHCLNASTLMALAESDMGISPTHWQRSTYPPEFQSKIAIVHEGVDVDLVRPDPTASFTLPSGRVLTRGDEIVTYAARSLEPMRGFHMFLRAAPEILRERPGAELVIVGAGKPSYGPDAPDGSDWKSFLLKNAPPSLDFSRVHFLDRQPYEAFLRLLQISSVHVYLTYPFVLSWSLLEAMSIGCVIVASDTAPVREALEDGLNGLLAPFHDSEAIASAVCKVLATPAQFAHLGQNARRTVLERYQKSDCVRAALRLLGVDPAVATVRRHVLSHYEG